MPANLLYALSLMGHGDDIAIVDRNFPAESCARDTPFGEVIHLSGMNLTEAVQGILQLFPLDDFVDSPVFLMDSVREPGAILPVHKDIQLACNAAEQREIVCAKLKRFDFYAAVKNCFAVVHTSEDRPYGNCVLRKGVIFTT